MEEHSFGWRQLLGAVNLKDFSQMVAGELAYIGTSLRLAFQSVTRLPLGPLLFVGALLIILLRLLLLVLVVIVFGTAILAVSAVRGVMRVVRGGSGGA
jgi:prepilin signal peptidase PulO-like enzyme (type II secretory pathway)